MCCTIDNSGSCESQPTGHGCCNQFDNSKKKSVPLADSAYFFFATFPAITHNECYQGAAQQTVAEAVKVSALSAATSSITQYLQAVAGVD